MSSLGLDASELVLEVGDEVRAPAHHHHRCLLVCAHETHVDWPRAETQGGSKVPDTVDQELHPTVSLVRLICRCAGLLGPSDAALANKSSMPRLYCAVVCWCGTSLPCVCGWRPGVVH